MLPPSRLLAKFETEAELIAAATAFMRKFEATRDEAFEPAAVAIMIFALRAANARTVLDIGASHGFFARFAARLCPEVVAHAFEMRVAVHAKMVAEIGREGLQCRVIPHLAGMSDRHEGERTVWISRMRMYETEPGPRVWREPWYLRARHALMGRRDRDVLTATKLLITSTDAVTADTPPDFIKIDVEGYEPRVLAGGIETFRRGRPVILLEVHQDEALRHLGSSRGAVVQSLVGLGYHALLLTDRRDASRCDLKPIDSDSPALRRQRTEMILLH